MPIKLALTDIDGTILPVGQSCVSRRTIAAFHAALDAGMHVGPASGRGYSWVTPFFGGDEECCATTLASNGLEVYSGGERVLAKTMNPDELAEAAEITRSFPHAGFLCFDGGTPLLVAGTREDLAVSFSRYAQICVEVPAIPDRPFVKANAFVAGDMDATRELSIALNEGVESLEFDLPMERFLNVMPLGWNKGAAVAWLADYLGVGLDEVVVFGDAGNDISMFKRVTHSVAVENAMPEAANAARWHIGNVEDDAVAAAIEALAAGEWPFVA